MKYIKRRRYPNLATLAILKIAGIRVQRVNIIGPKKHLKILAIIAVYNEEDVIGQVIEHYMHEGVDVYLLDNGSTDRSRENIQRLQEIYPDRIKLKTIRRRGGKFDLTSILNEKESIAINSGYDWIISADADEIRCSPDPRSTLQQYITAVDEAGYNALDFTVLDFRPTKDGFDGTQSIKKYLRYFEFGKRPGHFKQVKAWKNEGQRVNLVAEGGHNANFENRKIYPLKFLLKHYSLRSAEQLKRKLNNDRKPSKKGLDNGWHGHYNILRSANTTIWKKDNLIRFNIFFYYKYAVERLTGKKIPRE
jgi:glycosyltransferase involved in cell wall biosynthesis